MRPIAVDVVRTPAEMDLGSRLLRISDAAELWIEQYKPEVVAIERVFAQHNVSTAMGTGASGRCCGTRGSQARNPGVFPHAQVR